MAHACAFFNNKGGVGKTTNIANLGDRLARTEKVVVVDLDPQCNLTQYYMDDESWEDLFLDQSRSTDGTIWKIVRPLSQSKLITAESIESIPLQETGRFGFDLGRVSQSA